MTVSEPTLHGAVSGGRVAFKAAGAWTTAHADALQRLVDDAAPKAAAARALTVDVAEVRELDTLGAWLLERLTRRVAGQVGGQDGNQDGALVGLPERFRELFGEVHQVNRTPAPAPARRNRAIAALEAIGRRTAELRVDLTAFLEMLALLSLALVRALRHPRGFRLTSTVHHLYRVGWQAVPIMVMITFLIGGIIAQQGIFHFSKFGAESYVVDMVGILVLREIGVLLIAIMSAGRSGSSYTAELGSMKMREEIDALRTMGFDPIEVLILPRVVALVIALPVLAFLGSMAALLGGGLVSWLYGGMSPMIFLERLREAVSITHFEVGMIKAPFMALAIGIIASVEGLRVAGSAESLGLKTTTSVVKSIFLVIVLDAVFSILFSYLKI